MPPAPLQCPTCGAPAHPDARTCTHCSSTLTAIRCDHCLGALFASSRFCPHCGRPASPGQPVDLTPIPCPRCRTPDPANALPDLRPVALRSVHFDECPRCGGVWLDTPTFQHLVRDAQAQSDALAFLGPARGTPERTVRYLLCPLCDHQMHRHNYARRSGVVLDRCHDHGLWFDHDELRQILQFIRSGGLTHAHQADTHRQRIDAQRRADENFWLGPPDPDDRPLLTASPTPNNDPATWLRHLLSELLRP